VDWATAPEPPSPRAREIRRITGDVRMTASFSGNSH
jgi:hypothetical protein